jgi:phosphohistidine phosphatase
VNAPEGRKILQLVRHAKSSWADAVPDVDRPLSGRGRRAADALARQVAKADERPQIVVCSPAERARQTLTPIEGVLGSSAEIRIDPIVYDTGPVALLELLRSMPPDADVVMVIGHNPTIHDVALRLVVPDDSEELARLRVKFPTGALATLILPTPWARLAAASARLQSLWTPR